MTEQAVVRKHCLGLELVEVSRHYWETLDYPDNQKLATDHSCIVYVYSLQQVPAKKENEEMLDISKQRAESSGSSKCC